MVTVYDKPCMCDSEVVTPAGLIHPLLLPKVYPPLFTLYALYNEKEDEKYWRRVRQWNKQPDVALMAYLGMDQCVLHCRLELKKLFSPKIMICLFYTTLFFIADS